MSRQCHDNEGHVLNSARMDDERFVLEEAAKLSVCACHYYHLCDTADSMTDDELRWIISEPRWGHYEAFRMGHITEEELEDELRECNW